MLGAIRKRDILAHPLVTIHSFGWGVFLKALTAGRQDTFLSLLARTRAFRPPTIEIPEALARCVDLESRAGRIYASLASRFLDPEPVREFFATLSHQEQEHFEMLSLCRELGSREGWLEESFTPWREAVPRLERQMGEAEDLAKRIDSVAAALRLVIRIESSEINRVFAGAVAATDSSFVRNLQVFQIAGATHLTYICDQIPKFEPDLSAACADLTNLGDS
jgi:rubrerythrin